MRLNENYTFEGAADRCGQDLASFRCVSVYRIVPVPVPKKKFPLGLESGKISRTQLQLSEEWKVWRTQLQLSEEVRETGLIMYNNVRWSSRGNVLQRFVVCLEEIRLFLQNESKIEQYPQLMDIIWLLKLMFFTDICQHFNELNIKLQGPNKTVIVMMDLIRAFEAKLYVFKNDIITKNSSTSQT
ncbi:general transcription factor II-I repeat domain-containing protein 2A [Trichonephila clavipes]|nr:general transcription factor II-I repeat domain-containing protein 2A [Trichonephila clavipes]